MSSKTMSTAKAIGILGTAAAAAGLFIFSLCWLFLMHTEVVEPGQQLVINDKPYFFGHEGVRPEPITEGRVLLWRTSSATPVTMTVQTIPERLDDFSDANSVLLDFETAIQFKYTDSVKLISKFGPDWYAHNLQAPYRQAVREAVKKREMNKLMTDPSVAQEVDNEVTEQTKRIVAEEGLPIVVLNVTLGRAKPNPEVLQQMNATAAKQQLRKTIEQSTLAEKDREQEQIAKARADNAYRNAMGLTPEMFVQLEQVRRYSEACSAKGNTCVIGLPSANVMVPAK